MNLEDEVLQLKQDIQSLKKNTQKDVWDKLQVIGAFLIPVAIALFAWVQNTGTEAARQNSNAIQLKLDSLHNEREITISTINSKVGQVNLVSNFFDALLSKDEARKKLAIKSVLIALPDDGPDLVRIVSANDEQSGLQSYAQKSLDERSEVLIRQMYADAAPERLRGFNDLFSGWKSNSDIIPRLMNYANEHNTNANGIYNTLVFLSQMDKNALIPYVKELKAFSNQFNRLGPNITARGDKLESRLP